LNCRDSSRPAGGYLPGTIPEMDLLPPAPRQQQQQPTAAAAGPGSLWSLAAMPAGRQPDGRLGASPSPLAGGAAAAAAGAGGGGRAPRGRARPGGAGAAARGRGCAPAHLRA
jgi:hypothetical protein